MKVKMTVNDPLSEIRDIAREWAKLNRERGERLGSGDEKVVLATISTEYALPARAKMAVLNWLDDRLREAQDLRCQLETERQRILEERRPIEEQAKYFLEHLGAYDRELASLNEQVDRAGAELASLRSLRARTENAQIRTFSDVRNVLQMVGLALDFDALEGRDDK